MPGTFPVTTPALIDATFSFPLLQVPPVGVQTRVVVPPGQTVKVPVIAERVGKALKVMVAVVLYATVHAPFVTAAR